MHAIKNQIYFILFCLVSVHFSVQANEINSSCRRGPKSSYLPMKTEFPKANDLSALVNPKGILISVHAIGLDQLHGPEALEILPDGRILTGLANGDVVVVDPSTNGIDIVGNTKGRPISVRLNRKTGELVIADLVNGLMKMSWSGESTILAQSAKGVPLCMVDDVAVAADGTIYVSVASTHWTAADYEYIALENSGDGIVVAYNESWTEKSKILAKDLYFANGLTLTEDQKKLLVVESTAYRITQVDLVSGEKQIWIDSLPGIPDNISLNPQGNYWLSIVSPRSGILEYLQSHPLLNKFIFNLHRWGIISKGQLAKQEQLGLALEINKGGKVVNAVIDPGKEQKFNFTSTVQIGNKIYFGTFKQSGIHWVELK